MSNFYKLFGVSEDFDRFQTSYILPRIVLAIIRLIIALYIFSALIYKLCHDDAKNRQQSFSYFTNLTYWGLGFYFLASAFHGVRKTPQEWPRPLRLLHSLFYTTIINYPLLVTIVYWTLLAPDSGPFTSPYFAWSNISFHAINSVFALFEIFFTRTKPPPWIHMTVTILLLALYLGLAYVTYATQGFYTYNFLNPDNGAGSLAGYILGIFAGSLVIFVVVWLLVCFREWAAGKLGLRKKWESNSNTEKRGSAAV